MIADKVFLNGKIDTQDDTIGFATAFAIKEEKFIAVGTDQEIKDYIGKDTQVIDLNNKRVLPGFNDCHMHFLGYCIDKSYADLRGAKSIKEIQDTLSNHQPKGLWVIGSGWNDTLLWDKRLPNRHDLDGAYPDKPVMLSRICYHICVVNSKALEIAGINENTPDPDGGKIDKDEKTGMPTGILRENAVNLVYDKIEKLGSKDTIKEVLQLGIKDALKVGLTSIQTDDFENCKDFMDVVKAYKELADEKLMPIRINLQMRAANKDRIGEFVDKGLITGEGDSSVKVGPVKIMSDGSLGSRTAAMIKPYSDKADTMGILIHTPQELDELIMECEKNRLQVAVHAIGDRAMEEVLTVYENVSVTNRPRIIHCQITNSNIIDRFKNYNVIADIQPTFVSTDYKIVESRVGVDYAQGTYNWKTMIDRGIKVAAGSDSPIEDFNPILGIYAAVTRKDLDGNPKEGWLPDQCLKVDEAIKLYTVGSAYASFEENMKGSITQGKLADFLILSDDIYDVDSNEIKNIEIESTYIGGERVY